MVLAPGSGWLTQMIDNILFTKFRAVDTRLIRRLYKRGIEHQHIQIITPELIKGLTGKSLDRPQVAQLEWQQGYGMCLAVIG